MDRSRQLWEHTREQTQLVVPFLRRWSACRSDSDSGTSPAEKLTAQHACSQHIMNSGKHPVLYKNGMRPVFRCAATSQRWRRIPSAVKITVSFQVCVHTHSNAYPQELEKHYRLSFEHRFNLDGDTVFFAFTYPYSYDQCQERLATIDLRFKVRSTPCYGGQIEHMCGQDGNGVFRATDGVFYHRELLASTRDGRRVDLLTISDERGVTDAAEVRAPELSTGTESSAPTFEGKEYVFVRYVCQATSEVRPCELVATVHGCIQERCLRLTSSKASFSFSWTRRTCVHKRCGSATCSCWFQ
jgi:hypothetical protein